MNTKINRKRKKHLLLLMSMTFTFLLYSNTYSVSNTNDAGAGSFRQALLDANANAGLDSIYFNIAGTGPHTIQPVTLFPLITSPVLIDGITQSGASCSGGGLWSGAGHTLMIELDGSALTVSTQSGLELRSGSQGSTIMGLVINNFPSSGIRVDNSGNTTISCNYLGTDVTGTLDRGNGEDGLTMSGDNNTIGGTTAGSGNLISGNDDDNFDLGGDNNVVMRNFIGTNVSGTSALDPLQTSITGIVVFDGTGNVIGSTVTGQGNLIGGNSDHGISLQGSSTGTVVIGNYIGTNITGTSAIPNMASGVFVNRANHIIGGASVDSGNVISGSSSTTFGRGIWIQSALATGNRVQGNYIGTNATGTSGIPNVGGGVYIAGGASSNIIGGAGTGQSNLIAYNGKDGVAIVTSTSINNTILGNVIHSNIGLGIDLNDDGVTNNDVNDSDAGSNDLLNFPVVNKAELGSLTVDFELDVPAGDYRVEVFGIPTGNGDVSGHGEGNLFLGSFNINHPGGGSTNFVNTLSGFVSVNLGDSISLTVTECLTGTCTTFGSTSEFSALSVVCETPNISNRYFRKP